MTLKDECGYRVYNVSKLHRPRILDAFLADTVDMTRLWWSCIGLHLRFCGVLCIARSFRANLDRHAQLTRCFSAVAELLVVKSNVSVRQ